MLRTTQRLLPLGATLGFGAFLALLNSTVVAVGLDRLSAVFSVPLSEIQWVSTAYLLALAVAIPVTGWGMDRFGGRSLWLAALLLFLLGSALATAAISAGMLIAARVLQGVGAGMLEPIMLTMLTNAAGPGRVTRVLSLIQIPITVAPAFGPLIGGVIVDQLPWRWLFGLNLPLGLLALVCSLRVLPGDRARQPAARLDVWGLALLSPGLAALLYGLARAGSAVGPDWGAVAAGGALMIGYLVHALRRGESALIDVRLFAAPRFTAGALLGFLFGTSVYGLMFLLPLYAQRATGARAWEAGLLLAPQGIGTIAVLPFVAALADRLGARITVAAGMLLAALGTLACTQQSHPALLAVSLLLRGVGLGLVLGPALSAAYRVLASEAAPRASSALVALIQLGGAAGTALLAVVLQRESGRPDAFGHTFWWALGICVLGALIALRLPGRQQHTHTNREAQHV